MKVYRSKKRRSCPFCKPHKVGAAPCWTPKDLDKLKRMEKELRENQVELDHDSQRALYDNKWEMYSE